MAKTAIEGASRENVFLVSPDRLTVITEETHPLYDERAQEPPDEELARDMDQHGNIEPVIIWKDGEELIVVVGRRRTAAARLIQTWREKSGEPGFLLRARVEKGDLKRMQHLMFSENAHRKDLSAVGRARQMERAVRRFGWTEKELAAAFHCSEATVRNDLALLDCSPEVQRAAEERQIPAAVARELSDLPRARQTEVLAEMKAKNLTKGRKASRAVKAAKAGREMSTKDMPPVKLRPAVVLAEWHALLVELERSRGGMIYTTARQVLEYALGGERRALHPRLAKTLKTLE